MIGYYDTGSSSGDAPVCKVSVPMTAYTHNPYDHFVRHAFLRPEVATSFFERYLPAGIPAGLDSGFRSLESDTFVDETLQLQQSDLLFTVRLWDGRWGTSVSAAGAKELERCVGTGAASGLSGSDLGQGAAAAGQ